MKIINFKSKKIILAKNFIIQYESNKHPNLPEHRFKI